MLNMAGILIAALTLIIHSLEVRAASAPSKLVIAHAAMNARVGPLWIALDHGFFHKYGVQGEMIFVRGAPTFSLSARPTRP